MIFKNKYRKVVIATAIALTTTVAGTSTAFAGITTPTSTLDSVVITPGNYAWLADATPTYNCLAYALGNYSSWVWPWGSSNPTSSQVNTYLSGKGYPFARSIGSYDIAAYEIISYGSSSAITHFSRIASGGYSNAKWGQAERLQSSGWQPYKSTPYGPGVMKYAK